MAAGARLDGRAAAHDPQARQGSGCRARRARKDGGLGMGKTKSRANGDGDVFPRKNKAGKITSYRGAYVGPDGKRRYVSGNTKEDARKKLRQARGDAERGLVSDGGNVKLSEYLTRWLNESVRGSVKP